MWSDYCLIRHHKRVLVQCGVGHDALGVGGDLLAGCVRLRYALLPLGLHIMEPGACSEFECQPPLLPEPLGSGDSTRQFLWGFTSWDVMPTWINEGGSGLEA